MQEIRLFIRRVARLRLPLYGANVCYFLVLSVFPGLLLVLSCLRHTSFSAMDLIGALEAVVPQALMGSVERFIVNTYYASSGAVVSVSVVAALWSASRSVYGLIAGLNQAYGVEESRSYVKTRLLSVVYLFVLLALLVATLVIHVFGQELVAWLEGARTGAASLLLGLVDVPQALLLAAQVGVFTVLYMVLPNRSNGFRESLPGAVLTAFGWQGFSRLFSLYAAGAHRYAGIYGPVYAVAPGMLWLYCCAVILLFGGAVNRWLSGK